LGDGGNKEGVGDTSMGDGVGVDDGDKEGLDAKITSVGVCDKIGNEDDNGNNCGEGGDGNKIIGTDTRLNIDGGDKEGPGVKIMGDGVNFGVGDGNKWLEDEIMGARVCDKKVSGDGNDDNRRGNDGDRKVGVSLGTNDD